MCINHDHLIMEASSNVPSHELVTLKTVFSRRSNPSELSFLVAYNILYRRELYSGLSKQTMSVGQSMLRTTSDCRHLHPVLICAIERLQNFAAHPSSSPT